MSHRTEVFFLKCLIATLIGIQPALLRANPADFLPSTTIRNFSLAHSNKTVQDAWQHLARTYFKNMPIALKFAENGMLEQILLPHLRRKFNLVSLNGELQRLEWFDHETLVGSTSLDPMRKNFERALTNINSNELYKMSQGQIPKGRTVLQIRRAVVNSTHVQDILQKLTSWSLPLEDRRLTGNFGFQFVDHGGYHFFSWWTVTVGVISIILSFMLFTKMVNLFGAVFSGIFSVIVFLVICICVLYVVNVLSHGGRRVEIALQPESEAQAESIHSTNTHVLSFISEVQQKYNIAAGF